MPCTFPGTGADVGEKNGIPAIRDAEVVPVAARAAHRAGFVSRFVAFFADALVMAGLLRGTVWFLTAAGRAVRSVAHRVNLGAALPTMVPLLAGRLPGDFLARVRTDTGQVVDGPQDRLRRRSTAVNRAGGAAVRRVPGVGAAVLRGLSLDPRARRRAWHDRLARTQVIYVPRAGASRGLEPLATRGSGV